MTNKAPSNSAVAARLERKIERARWALFFEDFWPRLWILIAVGGLFLLLSLTGAWPLMGDGWHAVALAAFGVATILGVAYASRARWPQRQDAMRRLERDSGVAHRPASSYEDTLQDGEKEGETSALWRAHQSWLSKLLDRLRVTHPKPRVYRHDPLALRLLLLLFVVLGALVAGDGAFDRVRSAFRFDGRPLAAQARLDAWVTPPSYTGRAPVLLADGSNARKAVADKESGGALDVIEKSVLLVRASGAGGAAVALEIEEVNKPKRRVEGKPAGGGGGVSEARLEIVTPVTVGVYLSGSRRADWSFAVIPDLPPKIALTKDLERTPRGALKLTYKIEDDFGVAGAEARMVKAEPKAGPSETAWARLGEFRGPRFPLERPPKLTLRLPPAKSKDQEAQTYLEVGSHPWAGIDVVMTLEARDVAGKTGRSAPIALTLPSRRFEDTLARAVVEQRRKLVEDSRARDRVATALEAITLEPGGFIEDPRVYLGLRSAYHRLKQDPTRAGWKSVIDQLWQVALRIEDGDLSEAERALRDAQDKLSKALEDGASDDQIKDLMADLRKALEDYMEQMAKQAEGMENPPPGMDRQNQSVSQQDLDQMMKNIEEMAKNGSRDQAQQMLSQLRDLMERMQTGRMAEQQNQKAQEMMQKLNELGGLVGEQQQLMDDTFAEQKNLDGRDGQQSKGQKGQKGKQAKGGKGAQGQQGQVEQGQEGQGQPGQRGQPGAGGLGQRQGELREKLRELQRGLDEGGAGDPSKLDEAQKAMEGAEQALKDGDLGTATEEQATALDKMRQGAQSMAQEMMQNSPQRQGQNGDTPRDPLGRPQRSQGPDLGTSVKVPKEIDMQRAREIMEELRRRLGDSTRPTGEIDYLERLLKRF